MLNHAQFLNMPEPLVLYRTNQEAYERRGGWDMFREELRLQWRFLRDGFTSPAQFLRNTFIRASAPTIRLSRAATPRFRPRPRRPKCRPSRAVVTPSPSDSRLFISYSYQSA